MLVSTVVVEALDLIDDAEAKAANESGNGLLDNKENSPAVEVEMKP